MRRLPRSMKLRKAQNIGSSVENVGKKFLPVTAAVTGLGTAAVEDRS